MADLDKFEEYVEARGLDEYKPNDITGTLTQMFYDFAVKWRGVVIYGLDFERGTEEVIIEIPMPGEIDGIVRDLEQIRRAINQLGGSITIVVLRDYVLCKPARNRREAYYGTPGRSRALKILRSIKRRGGNKVFVET